MESLPIELLDVIASQGSDVYYGLLGYKFFVDSLTFSKQVDFMILFEHSIKITKYDIKWMRKKEVIMFDQKYGKPYKAWYRDKKYHRKYGPAIEWPSGDKEWYLNGERHRDDGPAVEMVDGTKQWWRNGKLQREEYPTIQWFHGNLLLW